MDGAEQFEQSEQFGQFEQFDRVVPTSAEQRPRDPGEIQRTLRAQPDLDHARVPKLSSAIADRGFARGQNLVDKRAKLRSRLG